MKKRLLLSGLCVALALATFGTFSAARHAAASQAVPSASGPAFVRPAIPRIAPLEPSEWTSAHRQILGASDQGAKTIDFFKICLRHVELCRAWTPFTMHVARDSRLPRRDKELLILRTAYLSHDAYAWGEHAMNGQRSGLFTEQELAQLAKKSAGDAWGPHEAALIAAADELHTKQFISDGTWKTLAAKYDEQQLLDAVFTVGQYTMIAMYLNSAGVRLVPGWAEMPN